jgi:hypothetical protein
VHAPSAHATLTGRWCFRSLRYVEERLGGKLLVNVSTLSEARFHKSVKSGQALFARSIEPLKVAAGGCGESVAVLTHHGGSLDFPSVSSRRRFFVIDLPAVN